jgi:uncharacterized protein (DUF1800 family)
MTELQNITHLLSRAAFGPGPHDVEHVVKAGIPQFIDTQLNPERIDDSAAETRARSFKSLRMPINELFTNYSPPRPLLGELTAHKVVRAVYSKRQLQEVMSDFWYNHFNVFWGKGADRWLTTDFEINAIRPHALGNFRDLLLATAKSPAMLFYLDNHLSNTRRGINENYARELMELHTLGVDGGFTQQDVQEVARAFTGWSIDQPRRSGRFTFRPRMHDDGEKTILRNKLPAGGGMKDGEKVIDILAEHPSTARFIATKLVRRFTSDLPPEALIKKAASAFAKSNGNIRETLRAIFTAPEFYSGQVYLAKTKSPFELAVSAIRALGGNTDGSPRLVQSIARMGQPLYLYQPPTGFPDRADHWMSDGTLIERLNFVIALVENRIPGTTVDISRFADSQSAAIHLGSEEFQKR